jgi:Lar family restriction alleviation protein
MTEGTEDTPASAPVHALVLLPCPFCGGDSVCHEVRGNIQNPAEFYVTCVFQKCCGYHSESEGIWKTESDAVDAWNRRMLPTVVPELKVLSYKESMNLYLKQNLSQ